MKAIKILTSLLLLVAVTYKAQAANTIVISGDNGNSIDFQVDTGNVAFSFQNGTFTLAQSNIQDGFDSNESIRFTFGTAQGANDLGVAQFNNEPIVLGGGLGTIFNDGVNIFSGPFRDALGNAVTTDVAALNSIFVNVSAFSGTSFEVDLDTTALDLTPIGVNSQLSGVLLAQSGGGSVIDPITSAIPEPATWLMMIMGFGLVGVSARRRKMLIA